MTSVEIAVIGGGIHGWSTAHYLMQRGVQSLLVIERFSKGHVRGSSHGLSRITRSAYSSEVYVQLMQLAHTQSWPKLEQALGPQLIFPCEGC